MKRMNKVLTFTVCVAMLLLAMTLPMTVHATSTLGISVNETTAAPSGEVTLTISLRNNPGFSALSLGLQYNTNYLTLTNIVNNASSLVMTKDASIVWDGAANYNNNGTLATLTFKISDNAPAGEYPITLRFWGASNENFDEVSATVSSGKITVTCPHTNTTDIPETPAKCNEIGYTAGVYCNGCNTYISGHDEIPATDNHTDADGKWEFDGTNHWHTCACEKEIDKDSCSGGTATCLAKAICTTCENAYGVLGAHDYTEKHQDSAHLKTAGANCTEYNIYWYDCSRCVANAKDDSAAADKFYTGTVAGEHIFTEQIENDAHLKDAATKCTEYNTYWYDCSFCNTVSTNQSYTGTVAGAHSFTEELNDDDHLVPNTGVNCQDAKKYYYDCAYCALIGTEFWASTEFGPHDYTEKFQDSAHLKTAGANCTEYNIYWYDCSRCAANAKDDSVAADKFYTGTVTGEHIFTEQIENDAHLKDAATKCTEYNTYWYDCSFCDTVSTDKSYVGTVAGEHSFSEKLNDVDHLVSNTGVNCQDAKMYYYDCAYCALIGSESWTSTDFGDHIYNTEAWGYKAAEGHAHICKYCDAHDTVVAHDPDRPAATEDNAKKCTECYYVIEKALDHICSSNHLTYHQAVSNFCTTPGNKAYYECGKCGEYYEDANATVKIADKESVNLPALNHDFTERLEDEDHLRYTATNCQEKTSYWYDCSRCDVKSTDNFYETEPGSHEFTEMLENIDHLVAGTGVNCQIKFAYYFDCKYCTEKSTETWTSDRVGEHSISTEWVTENGSHWKECGVQGCTHTVEEAVCSGGTATCKAKAICATCNEKYGDFADHSFSTDWTAKDGSHWHACITVGCTEVADQGDCSGGSATCREKATCSTCTNQYGAFAEHNYGSKWEYREEDGHSVVCQTAGCGEPKKIESHNPDSLGEKCIDCEYTFHTCGGKELTPIPEDPATCETPGMKAYYECSCGKYYEDIDAKTEITDWNSLTIPAGHKIVKQSGYPATCTENGLTNGEYCRACNTVFKSQTVIPSDGHDWSAWVTVEILEDGTRQLKRSCACGISEERSILPEHKHTVVEIEAKLPTCTETGLTTGVKCSSCGEIITAQKVVPATDHIPADPVKENVVEATATVDGSYELAVYCSVCFAELNRETIVIPALGEETTEPEVTEPEVTEPEVTEPEVTEPEVTEPEVTEPEVTEPEVTEPEVTEPEVTEPEVTEPEVTEPEVTEPEVTEPEITEPEVTEPANPGTSDSALFIVLVLIAVAFVGTAIIGSKKREE